MKKKVPYDVIWLVGLVNSQHPDEIVVLKALESCTHGYWISKAYVHFVVPIKPNKPGSNWQFDRNLVVENGEEGTIVIDVLKGNIIGGIEFVSYIGR